MAIAHRGEWVSVAILVGLLGSAGCARRDAGEPAKVRCVSTTSVQNSGLFEYLAPHIEREAGVRLEVVAVGTGAAFEIARRGDADLVLVHDREEELRLVGEGWLVDRRDLMVNDFLLVGPPGDPAGVRGLGSAVEAFSRIATTGARFVSRGDDSGTHRRERSLWQSAGLAPAGREWYLEVGQGMARAQRIASEKGAYLLTDRGTWLALRGKDGLDLEVMVEGDPALLNPYGIMAVNPERHPHVRRAEALRVIEFLTSPRGQALIGEFRDGNGVSLFRPVER